MADNNQMSDSRSPTSFQDVVKQGLAEIVRRHGEPSELQFRLIDAGNRYYAASASLGGRVYNFEIYDSVAYAQHGNSRYESGIFEFPDEIADAHDFVDRIERLAAGGSWFTKGDPGIVDSIAGTFRRFLKR